MIVVHTYYIIWYEIRTVCDAILFPVATVGGHDRFSWMLWLDRSVSVGLPNRDSLLCAASPRCNVHYIRTYDMMYKCILYNISIYWEIRIVEYYENNVDLKMYKYHNDSDIYMQNIIYNMMEAQIQFMIRTFTGTYYVRYNYIPQYIGVYKI